MIMTYELKAEMNYFLKGLTALCKECDCELYLAWNDDDYDSRRLCVGFNGTADLIEFDSADGDGVHKVVIHEAEKSLSLLKFPE